ncbi:CBN-KEL-8 protein [Caenorhabditis brenneri]|uniref:CBN-KEL-8 protein n=1 Tax=Caenorhabditis brenneri TaxID=135651 RepID=G0M8V7_CAEBE|nr:CBN-KEL-8 protein [Caenorhabditis brenneri]
MPVYARAIFGSFPTVQQVRINHGETFLTDTSSDEVDARGRAKIGPFDEFELVSNSVGSSVEYENQKQSAEIMRQMQILREDEELCDVELIVEGSVIRAHRYILAAASPYFKAMFTNGMVETKKVTIKMEELPFESMEIIVNYIYTDKIAITINNVHQLIFTATILQMDVIVGACQEYLTTMITSHNCLALYHFAETYNCATLKSSTDDFAAEQFGCIRRSPDFKSISFHHLKRLLNRSDLNVTEEQDVFEAIVFWVDSDPKERMKHFPELFETMRLHLIGWNYLCEVIKTHRYVKESRECRDIISAALFDAMTTQKSKNRQKDLANHENTLEYSATSMTDSVQSLTTTFPVLCSVGTSMNSSKVRKSISGIIFCAGGRGTAGGPFSSVEAYDWRKNQWFPVPDMMSQRRHVGVVSAKGNLYAIGGHDGSAHLATAEVFQPSLNLWKRIASMKTARRGIAVASIGNAIYAVGGLDDTTCYKTVERYDIEADEWSTVADMEVQRGGVGVAVVQKYLFAIGGNDGTSSLDTCERFDPLVDKWKRIARMQNRRAGSGVCVLDGYLYAIGGFDDNAPLATCERYDADTDKWQTLANMSSPRGGVGVAALGGKVYAIGGHDGSRYLNTVECYDPLTNCWRAAADIQECRAGAGVAWANVRMHQLGRTTGKCDSGCAPSGGAYCI